MGTRRYIIRLDDACEKRDIEKWDKIEGLLDKYSIKPLVGVIPQCEDPAMDRYPEDHDFWKRVHAWQDKGWSIAMHGYKHVYDSDEGGINPVNHFSEFAGHPVDVQRERIKSGVEVFRNHGIDPKIFFAPGHTFDENTLVALKKESNITIISDTIAWDVYCKDRFTFIPQQSGRIRNLPFRTITFCYHPNVMKNKDFKEFSTALDRFRNRFEPADINTNTCRTYNLLDALIRLAYFRLHERNR